MRMLSVRQPWAWAIMHGGKDVENRRQLWSYRGRLGIHASKAWDRGWAHAESAPALFTAARETDEATFRRSFGATGLVLGTVDLVDVHLAGRDCCTSGWAEREPAGGVTHLVLADPRPLTDPFPAGGHLGLWRPDEQLLERIREAA